MFSLALVLAPDILVFDLLRAAQGFAAAAAFSGGMAALAQEFEGSARLRAFSIVGTSFGVGLSLGPVASGLMIEAFGWRSIFAAVVIFAVLGFALGCCTLKESRDPDARGLDWGGALTFTAALGLFTYGLLLAPERGWGNGWVVGLLFSAALFLILFVAIERQVSRPMLDLSLFAYPRFVGVQLLAAVPAYGFVVLLILPVAAGLLTRWFHPATLCGTGLLISADGLFWLAQIPISAPVWATALPMLVIGTGISLPWGLMDGLAVSVMPKERAGMATGIFNTTRVAGEGVALAVVGAILSTLIAGRMQGLAAHGDTVAAAQRLAAGDVVMAASTCPVRNGRCWYSFTLRRSATFFFCCLPSPCSRRSWSFCS